jgi:uncharacterized protein
MRARLVAVLALVVVAAGCGESGRQKDVTVHFTSGASKLDIRAEVAATPDERTKGLMGRLSLRDDEGMLFLFPTPVRTGFWMKDTLIPLDIAFIRDGSVAEIRSMTPCDTNPCPLTTPAAAYDSALEVAPGVLERAGIKVGAVVDTVGRLPAPS